MSRFRFVSEHRHAYGVKRLCRVLEVSRSGFHAWHRRELRRLNQRCSRKRVARLMRDAGLVGAHARRRWRRGRPDTAPATDLVNRRFDPSA